MRADTWGPVGMAVTVAGSLGVGLALAAVFGAALWNLRLVWRFRWAKPGAGS